MLLPSLSSSWWKDLAERVVNQDEGVFPTPPPRISIPSELVRRPPSGSRPLPRLERRQQRHRRSLQRRKPPTNATTAPTSSGMRLLGSVGSKLSKLARAERSKPKGAPDVGVRPHGGCGGGMAGRGGAVGTGDGCGAGEGKRSGV